METKTAEEMRDAINARSAELRAGYRRPNGGTCYCDTLPSIEREGDGWRVNDSTGQADAEHYDSLPDAVEAALCWFASCCLDYTIHSSADPDAADAVAVALGDTGEAWDRFRGWDA